MRIAQKITLSFTLAIVVLVGVYAVVEITDETRAMRSALRGELTTLASETSVIIAKLEPADGVELLARAGGAADDAPILRRADDTGVAAGETRVVEADGRLVVLRGFVDRHGGVAAIEASRSTDEIDRIVRRTTITTIALVALIVVAGSLYSLTIGRRLIARPIAALVGRFRAVGEGDLARPEPSTRTDELGDLERALALMIDRLAAALDQLRHADRLTTVGKLASGMAHELGTPLNVVAGYAKLIATRQETGDEAVDSARKIGEQVDRITTLVRQLLDFARRGELRLAPGDVRATVARANALASVVAHKAGVAIDYREPDGALLVALDDGKLQQVIVNLAINAIQASPRGGRVELAVARAGADVRIDVIDHGAGITPENLPRVFEPFFTTKPVGEGTGLGLAVSHGIVAEHGGRIEVASTIGEGSRFSVVLPVAS